MISVQKCAAHTCAVSRKPAVHITSCRASVGPWHQMVRHRSVTCDSWFDADLVASSSIRGSLIRGSRRGGFWGAGSGFSLEKGTVPVKGVWWFQNVRTDSRACVCVCVCVWCECVQYITQRCVCVCVCVCVCGVCSGAHLTTKTELLSEINRRLVFFLQKGEKC